MDKPGLIAFLLPFVLCLPCLLVLLAAAGGVALVTGAVAWLAGEAIIVLAGVGATATLGAAAILKRRHNSAACEISAGALENRADRRC